MKNYSDAILDTVEAFLETCPALEQDNVIKLDFKQRQTGEDPTVRTQEILVDGIRHLVVVKRV